MTSGKEMEISFMLMYKSVMHPYFKYFVEFWLGFYLFFTLPLLKVIEELRGM